MAKIFISHAYEDKAFATPLAIRLKELGHDVWYDEFILTVGDSLREKIDEGLSSSDFGVVILSKNFFEKDWTQVELDGLMMLQSRHRKVILPIWLGVGKEEVKKYSVMLAARIGAQASKGYEVVAEEVNLAITTSQVQKQLDGGRKGRQALASLVEQHKGDRFQEQLFRSSAGVDLFAKHRKIIIEEISREIEEINKTEQLFKVAQKGDDVLTVHSKNRCSLTVLARNFYINSLSDTKLAAFIYRRKEYSSGPKDNGTLVDIEFLPVCRSENSFMWKVDDPEVEEEKLLTSSDVAQDILKRFAEQIAEPCEDFD
jgi:hypothetical protein